VAGRRVLVTGVGGRVGSLLAERLEADPEFEHVAGLDTRPPARPLARTEWIEADIRDPEIGRLIPPTRVDTIVHDQIVRQPSGRMSPRTMHDVNVIGSLQLLAACERTATLERIVVRGSAGIYGSAANAPQFFSEGMTRLFPLRTRFQRDVAEIENYFGTYARRHGRVTCTMLRYQPAIGPTLDSQLARYLSQPVCPTYLGFDPRLQLVHEDDAVDALVAAVKRHVRGAVNVAGPGTIGLARMIRLAGRVQLPVAGPLFGPLTAASRRLGLAPLSDDLRLLLRHGRGVDITRLVEEVGFTPRFSTVDAVRDWVARHGQTPGARARRHAAAAAARTPGGGG
jgi:UDP-glucose 4-epimerase